jgi:hypothetical protein
LKRNPPAEHTYAYNQYQMNLAITQAQLAESIRKRKGNSGSKSENWRRKIRKYGITPSSNTGR